ncbi:uncharacterized protein LOC144440260 [Glandiceps talaboti]
MDADESFVSINLETNECEICEQDTGETLTTCQFCLNQVTEQRVKQGFNHVIHIDTLAHNTCFDQSHQILQEMEPNPALLQKQTVDSISPEHIKNVINGKIQWLINYAKNVSTDDEEDEKLQITCNKLQVHSTPCSRSTTPCTSPKTSPCGTPKSENRRNSHDVSCSRGHSSDDGSHGNTSTVDAEALQNSYRRYLFGGKTIQEWKDNKENKQGNIKLSKSVGDLQLTKKQRSALQTGNGCHGNRQLSLDGLNPKHMKDNKDVEKHWNNSDDVRMNIDECKGEVTILDTEDSCQDNTKCHDGSCQDNTKRQDGSCQDNTKCHDGSCQDNTKRHDGSCQDNTKHHDGSCQDNTKRCDGSCQDNTKHHDGQDQVLEMKDVYRPHQGFTANHLDKYCIDEIQHIVNELATKVEEMSTHLVNILQEKDGLSHQISVRHATIAKLVKINQHKIQVKRTSVLA